MERIASLVALPSPLRVGLVTEFGGLPIGSLGAGGILTIVILLVLLGRLVPRRTLEDTIADRDQWREAHKTSEEARIELQQQVGELLELSRVTSTFIQAIPLGVLKSREEASD